MGKHILLSEDSATSLSQMYFLLFLCVLFPFFVSMLFIGSVFTRIFHFIASCNFVAMMCTRSIDFGKNNYCLPVNLSNTEFQGEKPYNQGLFLVIPQLIFTYLMVG